MSTVHRLLAARTARPTSPAAAVALALLGCCVAPGAAAQVAEAAQVTAAKGVQPPQLLQEIVVIARHRRETLEDVPISITAIGGNGLQDRQITTTEGITQLVPNLQFSAVAPSSGNSTTGVIYIRGVGETDFLASEDPGVGFYLDGVYLAAAGGSAVSLLDIDHIEVLRGPQGTLFGRNTNGGAIQVITNQPSLSQADGRVSVAFGRFDRRDVTFVGNLPLSDTLALRIAVTRRVQNGYVTDIANGNDLGGMNTDAGRVSLLWRPNEGFDLLWESDFMSDHNDGPPTVFGGMNTSAQFAQYASQDAGCPGYSGPPAPVPEIADPRCANNQYLALGPFRTDQNGPERSDTHLWGSQLTATWRPTGDLTLKSITAYRETRPDSIRDADNTPLIVLETINQDDMKQFSQELQVLGAALDSRLHWQAGAYYFRETDPQQNPAYLPSPPVGGLNTAAWIKNLSEALYTQESLNISERLQATAGVRYTRDVKDATPYFTPAAPLPYPGYANYGYYIAPYPTASGLPLVCLAPAAVVASLPCAGSNQYLYAPVLNQLTDNKVTPMASLRYFLRPGLMTYASYSEGYKSGGFNTRIIQPVFEPNDPSGRQALPSFGPETVNSYEVGAKLHTGWLRVDGDVFVAKYRNMQIEVREGAAPVLENAGAATIKGLEIEADAVPVRSLSIDFGLGFTDFGFDTLSEGLIDNPDGGVHYGNLQAYTPRWNGHVGLSYRVSAAMGTFVPRVDGSVRSRTCFDSTNVICQSTYEVYNASVRFIDSRYPVSLTAGVDNLTDRVYLESAASGYYSPIGYEEDTYAPPREWFLEGTVTF